MFVYLIRLIKLSIHISSILPVMLVVGVKESTRFNSVFTVLNLLVVIFVVIAGSFHINFHNWNLSKGDINGTITDGSAGSGGFFPFGFSGMMSGAATCFYGKIGSSKVAY